MRKAFLQLIMRCNRALGEWHLAWSAQKLLTNSKYFAVCLLATALLILCQKAIAALAPDIAEVLKAEAEESEVSLFLSSPSHSTLMTFLQR